MASMPAEKQEPDRFRCLHRDSADHEVGDSCANGQRGQERGVPGMDSFAHGDDGGEHQAEKEAPNEDGVVLQDPLQPGGERQDGNRDAGQDGDQKAGVYRVQGGGDVQPQKRLPEGPARAGANAHHEFFVDTKNECHRAAGYAGHDICATHGKAARDQAEVRSHRTVWGKLRRQGAFGPDSGFFLACRGLGVCGHDISSP